MFSNILLGAAGFPVADLGEDINQSLRFRGAQVLSRTFSGDTNRDKCTFSAWIKRSDLSGSNVIFGAATSNNTFERIIYNPTSTLSAYAQNGGTDYFNVRTSARWRDPNAWYHLVYIKDTTQSTSTNRIKFFINGQRIEFDDLEATHFPTSNSTTGQINNDVLHTIGRDPDTAASFFEGYLAHVYFLDDIVIGETNGVVDEFGRYNEDGVWVPDDYTGNFGTNGFHLDFADSSAPGNDVSGNDNDWTATGFDTSAISSSNEDNDVDYNDTPTSNYATLNPLNTKVSGTTSISNANLRISATSTSGYIDAQSTIAASASDCYCEVTIIEKDLIGIGVGDITSAIATGVGSYITWREAGDVISYPGNNDIEQIASYDVGDTIGMTITSTQVAFYKNGSLEGTYTHNLTGDLFALGMVYDNGSDSTIDFNFGQMPFIYTVPTGFSELQTNNLPEPTIKKSQEYFETIIWDGNDVDDRAITTTEEFAPDLVWIKCRDANSTNHEVYDTIRGAGNRILPNLVNEQDSPTGNLKSFTTTGFTLGTSGNVNGDGNSYVAWCWKAGDTASVTYTVKVVNDSGNKYRFNDFGTSAVTLDLEEGGTYVFDQSDSSNSGHPLRFSTTSDGTHNSGSEYTTGVTTEGTPGSAGAKTTITVASGAATLYYYCSNHSGMGGQANTNDTKGSSNFDGTTQSRVTANTDAGFSIINYRGAGANATVGHGLNSTPEFIIFKDYTDTNQENWNIYHSAFRPRAAQGETINFNTSSAADYGATLYNSTAPTSSLIHLGNNVDINDSGEDVIAYCWHSVEGYSKFGQYEGNGTSGDGPFVYTGHAPQFLIIKAMDVAGDWVMLDSIRTPNNPNDVAFKGNSAIQEAADNNYTVDFLSNGFKVRNNADADLNQNNRTYIYMSWAMHPFGGENAPPVTAR